jgi:transcriptional regulator with XRE-family HTH domain
MTDREAIEKAGVTKVAKAMGVTQSMVSNWKKRGVPWPRRQAFAEAADGLGVVLDYAFVTERHR